MITYSPTTLSLDFVNNTATIAGEDYTMDRDRSPLSRNVFQQYGGPITFSRGTQAMVTDSTGRLTYAPNNLLVRSEEFDNAAWSKVQCAINSNVAISPVGTMTSDRFVPSTEAIPHYIDYIFTGITTNCIGSLYVKLDGTSTINKITLFPGSSATFAHFNLSNNTTTREANVVSNRIVPVGDGWFRLEAVWPSSITTNRLRIYASSGTRGSDPTPGDGTSGIFIWGAQQEQVTYQSTARAYIPTTANAYFGPRFDHDPITLQPRGLLIEEARTNLLTYSEQFDNSIWIKATDVAVTPNTVLAPNGLNTATTVSWEAAALNTGLYNGGASTSDTKTRSIWIRADVAGGTVTVGNPYYAAVNITPTLTTQWQRVEVAQTPTGGFDGISIRKTASSPNQIYIWGAQLEVGSFATSYIPTVASAATRNADVVIMTGTNFSSWYNPRQGTFIGSMALGNPTSARNCVDLRQGTSNNNQISLFLSNTAPVFTVRNNGNSAAVLVPTGTVIANTIFKLGAAYSSYNSAATLNGGTPATDSTREVPITLDRMWIGSAAGVVDFPNGYIRSVQYYPQRLSNNNIRLLTT
jgi:hypothetical protein